MRKIVLNALPLIPIFILWNIPLIFGGFVLQGNILWEFIFLELGALVFFSILAILSERVGRFYLIISVASLIMVMAFLIANIPRFSLFYAVSFVISIRYFLSNRSKGDVPVGSTSILILVILLILSTSLRFVHLTSVQPGSGYIFSIYDNSPPIGIPFTYAYGLVMVLGPISLTFSPITGFAFPLIAYLTSDNTFRIIDFSRSGGAISLSTVIVTSIACQCENTIGIISGTVSSFALSILPYFIFLSIVLLILTNLYLRHPIKLRLPRVSNISIVVLFISILSVEFTIVYSGMIYDLAVFGFNSFLTLFSGFLFGRILRIRRRLPIYFVLFAFSVQIILFFPSLIRYALVSPSFFEVYNLMGLLAGFLISLSFSNRNNLSRLTIFEFVFSMETMIAAVLLYLAIFSVSFFSGYSELAVIDFSVFILLISLPAMWFSNIFLLSTKAFGS